MNLQLVERSRTNTPNAPKISVSKKGNFYVNTIAMQHLGVTKAVKVKMFQDANNAQAWYLHLCTDGYVTLAPKTAKDGSGQMNMTDIAQKIINSYYHIGKKSLQFTVNAPVEQQGLMYYPLTLIKQSLVMDIPNPNGK